MDARELRIGNWVRLDGETMENFHDDYLTDEFEIKGFGDGSGNDGCSVVCFYEMPSEFGVACSGEYDKFIEPIELTEEWLEKLGFRNHHYGWSGFYYNEDLNTEIEGSRIEYCGIFSDGTFTLRLDEPSDDYTFPMPFNKPCRFVHELQNLCFALTGKELELKS